MQVTREENSADREMTPLALASIRLSRLGRTHATFCNIVGLCYEMLQRSWENVRNILQHPKMLQQKCDHF